MEFTLPDDGPMSVTNKRLNDLLLEMYELNMMVRRLLEQGPAAALPPTINLTSPEVDLSPLAQALGNYTPQVDLTALYAALEGLTQQPDSGLDSAILATLADLKKEFKDLGTGMRAIAGSQSMGGGGQVYLPPDASINLNAGAEIEVKNDSGNPLTVTGTLITTPLGSSLSTLNSTSTPLGIAGVFTGTFEDRLAYAELGISIYADVASATNGLVIQYSANGTTVHDTDTFQVPAGNGQSIKVSPTWRYFRVVYTNGAVAQTTFQLQTVRMPSVQKSSTHRIADSIDDQQDSDLVTAVMKGQLPSGTYTGVQTNSSGHLLAVPTKGTYGGAAGISGTVNVPAGAVVRSYAAQSGSVAASIVVPGVSGTITVPGSNQAQTQFADYPDPGTLVGPCSFIFSSTASYVVTWVS